MAFQKAVKYNARLRMAIAGPAGSGKTWTALTIATALAGGQGVALIDTEHGSASKYADDFDFDSQELTNFHPHNYINAIREAEAGGYAVLIIDSLSHAWSGTGGVLEEKDRIAKAKYSNNTFSAWNDATKLQNLLVQTILGSKLHIIVTVRSKMDYIIEKNANGRDVPRKVGMAPVQRDDLPYEFDVFANMEMDNTMIIDKSRCSALAGQVILKPDAQVAHILKSWLEGSPAPERPATRASRDQLNDLFARGKEKGLFSNLDGMAVYITEVVERQVTAEGITSLTNDEAIRVDYAIAGAAGLDGVA